MALSAPKMARPGDDRADALVEYRGQRSCRADEERLTVEVPAAVAA